MLVLARKQFDEVVIVVPPSSIERTIVVTNCGGATRIGFSAEPDVRVHRAELLGCDNDNEQAA